MDRNLPVQYVDWVGGMVHGDFGKSPIYQMPVLDILSQRIPVSLYLGFPAFVLHLVLGIPLGVIAAIKRGKWQDVLATFTANLGITVPIFWLGILLVYLFGIYLNWLPTFGYTAPIYRFCIIYKAGNYSGDLFNYIRDGFNSAANSFCASRGNPAGLYSELLGLKDLKNEL